MSSLKNTPFFNTFDPAATTSGFIITLVYCLNFISNFNQVHKFPKMPNMLRVNWYTTFPLDEMVQPLKHESDHDTTLNA